MIRSAVALAVLGLALATPAESLAQAGLLQKTEICSDDGDYAGLGSIAVMSGGDEILVVERADGTSVVRRLTSAGRLAAPFTPTGFPPDSTFGSSGPAPVVLDRGPPGVVFIADRYDFGRFYQASTAGAMQRDLRFGTETAGPQGLRYDSLVGSLASQTGELLLLDAGVVKVFDLASGRTRWADGTDDDDPRGSSSIAISTMQGAVAIGKTHSDGTPDRIDLFARAGDHLDYRLQIPVPGFLQDIAGSPDNTIWALAGDDLYRYDITGRQLDAVDLRERDADAIDTSPDGSVWVTTGDGVLHIGAGGTAIPPIARSPCGPPRISSSYASSQPLLSTHRMVLRVRCNEACTVRGTGKAEIPAGGHQYRLRGATVKAGAGKRKRLVLRFPRSAIGALRRALKGGRSSSVFLKLTATDMSGNRVSRGKGLTLG